VRLTDDGLEFLTAYDWPGNIRELHHVIERAVILSQAGELRIDLVLGDTAPSTMHEEARFEAPLGMPGILSEHEMTRRERENIVAALEKSRWKISGARGAAAILGVKPTTLASRLKRLGIQRPE
jgi:transcriptional regulator with GAF, ATPase, and Fis domain